MKMKLIAAGMLSCALLLTSGPGLAQQNWKVDEDGCIYYVDKAKQNDPDMELRTLVGAKECLEVRYVDDGSGNNLFDISVYGKNICRNVPFLLTRICWAETDPAENATYDICNLAFLKPGEELPFVQSYEDNNAGAYFNALAMDRSDQEAVKSCADKAMQKNPHWLERPGR